MSNTGITLVDVRAEAFACIKMLKEKQIDLKTAQEIRNLLNTVIDTGKTQVEFLKAIPDHIKKQFNQDEIKAIAGTLQDRDAEVEITLKQIEQKKKQTYNIS